MISPGLVVRAVLYAIAAMLLSIVVAVAWVAIYAFVIEPDRSMAFYQAYTNRVFPLVNVVLSALLLFAAGWLIGRGRAVRAALCAGAIVGLAYALIEFVTVYLFAGGRPLAWGEILFSFASKIAAAALGGWLAGRVPSRPPEAAPED